MSIIKTINSSDAITCSYKEGTIYISADGLGYPTKSKERVVFDGDYTIYYDKYGKKTVVHRMPDEEYDREKALLWALLKSKGVKPKDVNKLMDESIDKQFNRFKKDLKKVTKKFKQLQFDF